jgi:hypothetical protein
METYVDLGGINCVVWTDQTGAMHSMSKEAYDKQQAEQSTPSVASQN